QAADLAEGAGDQRLGQLRHQAADPDRHAGRAAGADRVGVEQEDGEVEGGDRVHERHGDSTTSTPPARRPMRKTRNSAGAAMATPTAQTSRPSRTGSGGLTDASQRMKNA